MFVTFKNINERDSFSNEVFELLSEDDSHYLVKDTRGVIEETMSYYKDSWESFEANDFLIRVISDYRDTDKEAIKEIKIIRNNFNNDQSFVNQNFKVIAENETHIQLNTKLGGRPWFPILIKEYHTYEIIQDFVLEIEDYLEQYNNLEEEIEINGI